VAKRNNQNVFGVFADHQRRTCIRVDDGDKVKFIPLEVEAGFHVQSLPARDFYDRFKPLTTYPVMRAAQLYLGYARVSGGSEEALDYLGQMTTVTNEDRIMATTKAKTATTKPAAAKAAPSKEAAPAKVKRPIELKEAAEATKPAKAPAKAAEADPKKSMVGKNKARRHSASQMFQDLIMEGKLTDDQIFEKVQKEFNLDEDKRKYVSWYRNKLKSDGKNLPAPKK